MTTQGTAIQLLLYKQGFGPSYSPQNRRLSGNNAQRTALTRCFMRVGVHDLYRGSSPVQSVVGNRGFRMQMSTSDSSPSDGGQNMENLGAVFGSYAVNPETLGEDRVMMWKNSVSWSPRGVDGSCRTRENGYEARA